MGVDFERSVLGRVLLSLLMVVTIGSLVLWNLPKGRPRDEVREVVAPLLVPFGLDQDWSVFAPDPRGFTVGFLANVTYEDGATRTWEPPEVGKVIAPVRTYRWQKYNERIRADDFSAYWYDAARFIAQDAGPGVTRVELLRRFQPVVTPGSGAERKPLETFSFYTWDRP